MLIEWKECRAPEIQNITEEDVAVVVVGSLEQHAKHLPVGTDVLSWNECGEGSCKISQKKNFFVAAGYLWFLCTSYGFSGEYYAQTEDTGYLY